MVYPDSNTPPLPDLDEPRIEHDDVPGMVKLRAAEHAANNVLTSLTIGRHDARSLAIARTKLQEAFMWAEKSLRHPHG